MTLITRLMIPLMSLSFQAQALECYQQSSGLQTNPDGYYELDESIVLTDNEQRVFEHFYRLFEGDWQGASEAMLCSGPDDDPIKEMRSSQVKLHVEKGAKNQLRVDIKREADPSRGVSDRETLYLFERVNLFQLNQAEETLQATEKFRQHNSGQGSRLVERRSQFHLQGEQLTLRFQTFINGHAISEETLKLHH